MELRELNTYQKKQLAALCEQMAKDIAEKNKQIKELQSELRRPRRFWLVKLIRRFLHSK